VNYNKTFLEKRYLAIIHIYHYCQC